MENISTAGIITRITQFREADVIGTILSESCGKIDFIARRSAKSRIRFAGGLSLFDIAHYELAIPRGSSSLYQLMGSSSLVSMHIARSVATFNASSLAVEIASEFSTTDDSSNSMVFTLLLDALQAITSGKDAVEIGTSTHDFVNQILQYSGLIGETRDYFHANKETPTHTSAIQDTINRQLDFCEHYLGKPLRTRRNLFA